MSLVAILCFVLVISLTLVITAIAARRTHSAEDFYIAGGRISGTQNGLAITGDFVSGATLLGTTALVLALDWMPESMWGHQWLPLPCLFFS